MGGVALHSKNEIVMKVKLEIRNGSSTVGAGTRLSDQLKADGLKELATKINADVVTSPPAGEAATQDDILVIIGNG